MRLLLDKCLVPRSDGQLCLQLNQRVQIGCLVAAELLVIRYLLYQFCDVAVVVQCSHALWNSFELLDEV